MARLLGVLGYCVVRVCRLKAVPDTRVLCVGVQYQVWVCRSHLVPAGLVKEAVTLHTCDSD